MSTKFPAKKKKRRRWKKYSHLFFRQPVCSDTEFLVDFQKPLLVLSPIPGVRVVVNFSRRFVTKEREGHWFWSLIFFHLVYGYFIAKVKKQNCFPIYPNWKIEPSVMRGICVAEPIQSSFWYNAFGAANLTFSSETGPVWRQRKLNEVSEESFSARGCQAQQ